MKKNKLILLLKIIFALLGILYLYLFLWNPFEKNVNQSLVGFISALVSFIAVLIFRKNEMCKFLFGLLAVLIGIIIYFVI